MFIRYNRNRYLHDELTDPIEWFDACHYTITPLDETGLEGHMATDSDFENLSAYCAIVESAGYHSHDNALDMASTATDYSDVPSGSVANKTYFSFQPFRFFSGGIAVNNELTTHTDKAYKAQQKLFNQRQKLTKLLFKKLDIELDLMRLLENDDSIGFIKLQIQVHHTIRAFDLKHHFAEISPALVELNNTHLSESIAKYSEYYCEQHGEQLPTAQEITDDPTLQAIQALVKELTGKSLDETDASASMASADTTDQDAPTSVILNHKRRKTQTRQSKTAQSSNQQVQSIEAYFSDFIGLHAVREEIKKIVTFLQVQHLRAKQGFAMKSPPSRHMVFTGNPGTGKTEMARLIAKIMYDKGIVTEDIFIEADRSDLIAEYLGQTAIKTKALIEQSFGGVLFIDEAYTLKSGSDDMYGDEAIATLLKLMEDHRDKVTVIVAGYQDEMQTFIESNPGLKSRFNRYVDFPDYDDEELFEILLKMAQLNHYQIVKPDEIKPIALSHLSQQRVVLGDTFANARTVRNYFEKVIEQQSLRVVNLANADLSMLTATDFYI